MIDLGKISIKDVPSIILARNKIRTLAKDLKFGSATTTRLTTVTSNLCLQIRHLPLIALSSLLEQDVQKCEATGFNGFLNKPIRREKLYQMMERILGEKKNGAEKTKAEKKKIFTQYSVREELKRSMRILLAEYNPVNNIPKFTNCLIEEKTMRKKIPLIFIFVFLSLSILLQPAVVNGEKPLIIAGDANFAPVEYIKDSKIKGFNIEIWQELSKAMGRPIEIQLMLWEDAQQKVLNGEADALTLFGRTEEREKLYDFSEPTLTFEFCFFVRSDNVPHVETIDDLEGKTIGVTKGGYARKVLEPNKKIDLLFIKNNLEGFKLLITGKIDAVGTDKWVGAYTIQKHQIKGINIVEKSFAKSVASIPVKKGNLKLLNEINIGINKLKRDKKIQQIIDRWSPKRVVFLTREKITRISIILSLALLFAVIVAAIFWIFTLKKHVKVQTRLLQESHDDLEKRVEERTSEI